MTSERKSQACYYPSLPSIQWSRPFFVIGLTGTIASGKSRAAVFLQEAGVKLLNADQSAKKILGTPRIQNRLSELFGKEIALPDGSIERAALAKIVFSDPSKRALLNKLIHPLVQFEFEKSCAQLDAGEILVYDVPLLFEAGSTAQIDLSITMDAPQELRYKRVLQRNGWSKAEFLLREESQFSAEEKKQLADLVLVNTGDLGELKLALTVIYTAVQKAKEAL